MPIFEKDQTCPLCNGPTINLSLANDSYEVECIRCGRFLMTQGAWQILRQEQRPLLSAYCRLQSESVGVPTITPDSIERFIDSLPNYSVPEKLDNMLELMARKSSSELGRSTSYISDRDYPLLIMRDAREAMEFERELIRRGYIREIAMNIPPALTVGGWERLEEIKRAGRQSSRVFVAMWFKEGMEEIYNDGIKPAIENTGYEPLRIDKHEHVNRIDDEIIGQIKRSRFMVADFTGQRCGVYFEAGMMQGLGRNVIWMCDQKELEGNALHFDVRQFNFVAYQSAQEAGARLYQRILAIEGEGPRLSTS